MNKTVPKSQIIPLTQINQNQPTAVVSSANHFLGFQLAQHLIAKNIRVIGLPCPLDLPGIIHKFPTDIKNFYFINTARDYYELKSQAKTYNFISEDFDYLFLTDLFASSYSPQSLSSSHLSILLRSTLNFFPIETTPPTKISIILPYFNRRAEQASFPFSQLNLPKLIDQLHPFQTNENLNVRTIMLGEVYGPQMDINSAQPISVVAKAIQMTKEIEFKYSPHIKISPLYIQDAVEAIFKSTVTPKTKNKTLMFVGPSSVTISGIISEFNQQLQHPLKIKIKPETAPLSSIIDSDYVATSQKLIHWRPKTYLDQGVSLTLKSLAPQQLSETSVLTGAISENIKEKALQLIKVSSVSMKSLLRRTVFRILDHTRLRSRPFPFFSFSFRTPRFLTLLWKPALSLVAMVVVLLIPAFLAFNIVIGSLQLRQSYQSLVDNRLTLASNQSLQSQKHFTQADVIIGKTSSLFSPIPFLQTPFTRFQNNLHLLSSISETISSSALSLHNLQQILISTLDKNDQVDPRVPLMQAQLYLDKTNTQLAYLQSSLPPQQPSYLSRIVSAQKYHQIVTGLPQLRNSIVQLQSFLKIYPRALGYQHPQTYMVLFQNNRQIRPTGGSIGSFALAKFANGKLQEWKIYKTYDTDRQLLGYVKPPLAIKNHQKNAVSWSLRDSNWDPDFPTTALRVQWFLNKEVNQSVDGVVALDVDALHLLVGAFDQVYLPDMSTTVTADNFYQQLESQPLLSEKQPSSDYLSSISSALLYQVRQIEDLNWPRLADSVFTAFQQKHMLASFNSPQLNSFMVQYGWNGSISSSQAQPLAKGEDSTSHSDEAPKLSSSDSSNLQLNLDTTLDFTWLAEIPDPSQNQDYFLSPEDLVKQQSQSVLGATSQEFEDMLYIVESNLGENQSNKYLKRQIVHQVNLESEDLINEQVNIVYQNQSPSTSTLGGSYDNYIRFYLPIGAVLQQVWIGELDSDFQSENQTFKIKTADQLTAMDPEFIHATKEHGYQVFGFYVQIPAQSISQVSVKYQIPQTFTRANEYQYRLSVRKQPGSHNDPYQLLVKYPQKVKPTSSSQSTSLANANTIEKLDSTSQNLTDGRTLRYNINLSQDKNFAINFIKQKIKSL